MRMIASGLASVALVTFAGAAPAADGPVQGRGYILAAPAGGGWSVTKAGADDIVFQRRPAPTRGQDAPYLLTAGAQAFADAALAQAIAADRAGVARDWLRKRLQAPRRDWVALDVLPATLHGARCAAYEAVQVDHYDPERILPDQVDDRRQYVQHGLLCVHPQAAGRLVQVFYNERFLRDEVPAVRVGETETREFFEGLRWTEKHVVPANAGTQTK
jgi:hypothetical protein